MQGINFTGVQNLNSETKITRKNENGLLKLPCMVNDLTN